MLRTDLVRVVIVHVPYSGSLVTRTGDDEATVSRKVERIDLLLVAIEDIPDALLRDVPDLQKGFRDRQWRCNLYRHKDTYADLFVFGAGSKILAVGTEADTSDIQIASLAGFFINKYTADTESSKWRKNDRVTCEHRRRLSV